MISNKSKRNKQSQGGGRYAALAVLAVIILAVVGYLLFSPRKKVSLPPSPPPATVRKPELPPLPLPAPHPVPPVRQSAPQPVEKPSYPVERPAPAETGPLPIASGSGKGQLAIIIDDMGASMQEARSLTAIGVPLTFSIIPGLRSYRDVASYAAANGVETMIHIPMQPKGWPQRRLEANGLLVTMEDADIREHLETFYRDIPKAVGANNHMGSEFTEHEDKMVSVLDVLKARGLFFIDSVTSPKSVAQRLAQEMGIRSGRRNVFLDNEQNVVYIKGQLSQAVRLAKRNGGAIAICHPHPETIKALSAALPEMERQGITLVPASRLVK